MKNNQMMVINEKSIFCKIKKFFQNIKNKMFVYKQNKSRGKKNTTVYSDTSDDKIVNIKNEFVDEIKVESKTIKKVYQKNNILEELDNNEKALNLLSNDRLRKLEKYYSNIIKQHDIIINKLS